MREQKWPIDSPIFNKINNVEKLIVVKGNTDLKEEFFNYAFMFKKSAHILTEYLLEVPDISKLDNYFFSLAYLYRHSLELILKAIGFKYIWELEYRKNFIKDTFHNLSLLLNTVYPYIEECIEKNREAFHWLKSIFEDMNDIDKESDSFRYPFGITVSKKDNFFDTKKHFGIKVFFEKQTHVNLIAFAEKMEAAFDILESYYSQSSAKNDDFKEYSPIFLEEGGSYYGQSVLGYSYSRNKFSPYVKAYTESAEYLYDYMSNNKDSKETLFIPMCYLYRNSIELAMKEILFEECSYNFQDAIRLINDKKHSILGLWNSIKSDIVKHSNAPKEDATIDNVEKYINQLHNIDGQSDKFRYPTNKYLDLHFKNARRFDIENVVKFFGELASFFSGVYMMMSAQNEWLAELKAEYKSDEYSSYYDY